MKIVNKTTPIFQPLENIDGNIVVGYKRPTTIKDPIDYLGDIDNLDLDGPDIYKIIDVCRKLYKSDFLCGTAIDVLNNFATTKLYIEPTGNKKFDEIVQIFLDNINYYSGTDPGIYHLMQRMGLGFLIEGNVVPLKSYQILDIGPRKVSIPTRITLLNPNKIWIEQELADFGPKRIYYRVDDDMLKILKKDGRSSPAKKTIPNLIKRKYKRAKNLELRNYSHIYLNPDLVDHLKRKAMDFDDWGVPYLVRAFRPLSLINRLTRLDEATLEGMINLITIFRLGSDEHPTDQSRINAFTNLIARGGKVEPNKYLVWAHDIDILQVGPDGKIMGYDKRYTMAIDAVKIALGLPGIIAGSDTGDPWPQLLPMMESLAAMRATQTVWLQNTLIQMAEENNLQLERKPKVVWDRMNLVDDTAIKNLIIAFYDRGLIDPETAIRESGRDWEGVLERKRQFNKSKDFDLFIPPDLPYSTKKNQTSDPSGNDGRAPEGDIKKKKKTIDTTASIFNDADKDVFNSYFDDMIDFAIHNKDDKNKIEMYMIGKYQQIHSHISRVNELENHYGIATICRKTLETSREKILESSDLLTSIRNEKINLYSSISNIRESRRKT